MDKYMMQAQEIISEWESKNGEEQQAFCRNCVLKSIRGGRKLKPLDEINDAVNSTYIEVMDRLIDVDELARNIEQRASKGFSDSLPAIVTRAANAVLQREVDRAKRDSVLIDNITTTEDGQQLDVLDTIATMDSTEDTAIISVTLKDFYTRLDSKNKLIFDGMVQGKTEREIAPIVGISNVAVHKRIAKIRAALASIL